MKPYILKTVEIGFAWDPKREIGTAGLEGAGLHLRSHQDKDLAQLLVRWTPSHDLEAPLDRPIPPGLTHQDMTYLLWYAGKGMGVAVGADPEALLDDDELYYACVKRFLAERQDG